MAVHTVSLTGSGVDTQVPVGASRQAQLASSPNGVAAILSTFLEGQRDRLPGMRMDYIPIRGGSQARFEQVTHRIPEVMRDPIAPSIAVFRNPDNNSFVVGVSVGAEKNTSFYQLKNGDSPMAYDPKHLTPGGLIPKFLEFTSKNYDRLYSPQRLSLNNLGGQFREPLKQLSGLLQLPQLATERKGMELDA